MALDPSNLEKGTSLWADARLRLSRNKLAMFGFIVVSTILAACFILPFIWGLFGNFDPNNQNLDNTFGEISGSHILGTDQLGRDMFQRVLEGGQISLLVAIVATILTCIVGIVYGSIAGYVGGKTNAVMMRIVDGLLAMPFLIIVILFRELIKPRVNKIAEFLVDDWGWSQDLVLRYSNIIPLIIAIAALGWLSMARIVRSSAAGLAKQEYVEAARSLGLSHTRIIFRHILPNMLGPIIIYATLTIPSFILYEATLSFIGLGIEPPYASWGNLIKEGANFLETKPAILFVPAVVFSLTLFAFNFLGDGLRDALDPKANKD